MRKPIAMGQLQLILNPREEVETEHSYPPAVRLVRVELLPGGLARWLAAPQNDEVWS